MFDIMGILIAKSLEEALEAAHSAQQSRFICGGTDIMIAARAGKLANCKLIGIRELPELKGIDLLHDGTIRIGAGECFANIASSDIIKKFLPALGDASDTVGSPQIRRVATIGGNLCNGAVSGDSVAILSALDATLEIASVNEIRTIPVHALHTGPGMTSVKRDEILKAIYISPENYQNHASSYMKYGRRNAMEIAALGCAANVKLCGGNKSLSRFALAYTVAAPVPVRCRKTEAAFAGKAVSYETLEAIAQSALFELSPRDSWRASKAFRMQIAYEMAIRVLADAIRGAGGNIDD